MKNLVVIAVIIAIGWYGNQRYKEHRLAQEVAKPIHEPASTTQSSASNFRCDGRTYCSQMTSCAEATFFIQNCPGTKMDGNNDGVPCESQWCN
jgi:hypothetical protein